MNKKFASAFLLAGTAIGSGMISLPMVLARFGIISTILIMFGFAALTYFTAIIRSDLNLSTSSGASLKDVGIKLGWKRLGTFANDLLLILSFALMAAYISGLSSIIRSFMNDAIEIGSITLIVSIAITFIFMFASKIIVAINKYLFITMFLTFIVLVVTLLFQTSIERVPQTVSVSLKDWATLVPVIFTSFGFQGSIHSVTKFCENDNQIIRSACFWGSLIPALVYVIWTSAILLVVANTDPEFFTLMLRGNVDVGQLIATLSHAMNFETLQKAIWLVSMLAILTSIFGVGLAVIDIFHTRLASPLVVGLPAIVTIIIPNAFIRILNISGIILAFMAIIAPTVLSLELPGLRKSKLTMLFIGFTIIFLGIMDFLLVH